ncbi:NlpC/P60 family protein [Solwaraspora sp. WMMD1047]|uniref:C40 family peptidase n=1 Tax=Solwaraspora sp. WMMD1047 TaxID=3016102 RepID=UPI0024177915|nr:NlpC/P60 family protein [Solwaraspora sp. WMMD1047]MDG4834625.1 NlpC/P60 family protein [Solwaraspora sp. WMMD1047]
MATPAPRSRPAPVAQAAARSRPRRWSLITPVLATVAGLTVALFGAAPAAAQPSVPEIEKQIDEAWNSLEPIIERHNATRQDLAVKKKQVAALNKKIEPLQLQIDLAMNRVGDFAVEAYKDNRASALNAVLATGSPSNLMDQLTVLDQFARRQQQDVQTVVELKNKYAAEKAPLDALVAELTKTEAELAKKKKQIDAEVDKLQEMRLTAYGNGSAGPLRPAPCPATYPGGKAGVAVKFACAQIGKPYYWGSSGPNSYDCSGLMLAAWAEAGVGLPHNAAKQRQAVPSVSRANLRPGDLVFYYADLHHVGMYVGNGWVVHAPQAGEPVKMKKVDTSPIHSYGRPG